MRQQNLWLTSEYKLLKDAFASDANVSPRELRAILPRHTDKSIQDKWSELGLSRPKGAKHHKPGWAAITNVLKHGPMSHQDIADALGCTRSNVRQIMARMRAHWHISGYRPSGHYASMTPIVCLGDGKDAPYPKRPRKNKELIANPFSAAAGLAKPINLACVQGRVVVNLWDAPEEIAA